MRIRTKRVIFQADGSHNIPAFLQQSSPTQTKVGLSSPTQTEVGLISPTQTEVGLSSPTQTEVGLTDVLMVQRLNHLYHGKSTSGLLILTRPDLLKKSGGSSTSITQIKSRHTRIGQVPETITRLENLKVSLCLTRVD